MMTSFFLIKIFCIHMTDFSRKIKKDNPVFVKRMPQHPHSRFRRKQKLEFDNKTLSEIPYINIDVPLDTKQASMPKNKIIDHIVKNSSVDKDRYYIEHEKGSITFKILLEGSQQEDKDRLIKLIFNMKKN